MRGQSIKEENLKEISIRRKFLSKDYQLILNKDLCNGCGICFDICPHEAIKILPSTVYEGNLLEKPSIDIDENICVLCGECAVLCPLNAISMKINGEKNFTIVQNEAFPLLKKEIIFTREKCNPDCNLKCETECPTEAIKVLTKKSENGKILEIIDVQIDQSSCIYCKRCEYFCNQNAIKVKKPFIGRIQLDVKLCPEYCIACVDICPSQAIQIENGKPKINEEFCIFCSACERVCPTEAIKIFRDWVFHTDITAAAWLTALRKLTSCETVAKELRIETGKKRERVVRTREIHNHKPSIPKSCTEAEEFLKILNKYKT